jgi:hypothetical protein
MQKLCIFAQFMNIRINQNRDIMKKLLLVFSISILSIGISAQSLSLSDDNGPIDSGATVMVVGDPMDAIITAQIDVTNNSSASIDVKVFRRIVSVLPNTSNYFCWGVCFEPPVDTSLIQLTIGPGETNEQFFGDMEPMEQVGSSYITYVFYDVENMADSVSVTVHFKSSPEGIGEDLLSSIDFSNAYPNPSDKVAYFDYSLQADLTNAKLVISNLLGAVVETVNIPASEQRIQINTAGLQNGLYICSLEVQNNVVATRKLIINH